MATSVTTDPGTTFTSSIRPLVYSSTDLYDPDGWDLVPFLWCDELKLACNAYSMAKLHYEIGHVMQPGDTTFDVYAPLDLRGKYVKVLVEQDDALADLVWVGYVLTDQIQRDGVKTEAGVNKFQGQQQQLQAVGLEWFLDRKQIQSSYVERADSFVEIQRALVFNGGTSDTIDMKAAHRGNRATSTNSDSLYFFSDDPTTEDKWTAADIVAHLLLYQAPLDSDDNLAPCPYAINPDDAAYLDGFHPTIASERQTIFQLLNKIISPQRGLCWWLEFDQESSPPTALVRVASQAIGDIGLSGDGNILPANANQIALNFDSELDVKSVEVTNQGKRNYHKVTCRGARQTCTFTVGIIDETLTNDWTDEAEQAYKDAAKDSDGYDALTFAKKADRNDAARHSDLLARVYSYFKIPSDWDGKSGDGDTAAKAYAIANISTTGSVTGGVPLTTQGLRLLNRTRLKLGVDYTSPSTPVDNTPEGRLEEFIPPFAILQVESEPDRYQYCDKMQKSKFHAGGTAVSTSISTPYQLRMQSHAPGFIVNAGGDVQHTIAKDKFDGTNGGVDEPSKVKTEVRWESLRATVCAEADFYAFGQSSVDPLPAGVPIEELVIDMGDDYRLDFIAANTIVDLKDGIPILADSAAILRDDRETLSDVARIAFQWYREDRQQLTVEFRQQRNLFSLGQLITTIGEGTTQSTINTVISVITYKFDRSGTMTIQTMDDTLDARALRGGALV